MKVSLISTVLNEEKNIEKFIDSIVKQTRKPDEIIIVDGGSKDKTYSILKKYSKKGVKVFQKKGNISQGRNYAIEKSKGDIIFTSDSSTRFSKDYVEKMLKGFDKDADIVLGRWDIEPSNIIERFLVSRTPNWDKVDPEKTIPSNRHVAFRKEVWEKVGGFPEHLRRADDNWFHLRAHELGFKYVFVKEAKVIWLLERNLKGMLKLGFEDSKTEGFSSMFIKRKIYVMELLVLIVGLNLLVIGIFNPKILFYSFIGGILLALLLGGILTLVKTKDPVMIIIGPFLYILLYFTHVFGLISGIFQSFYKESEN